MLAGVGDEVIVKLQTTVVIEELATLHVHKAPIYGSYLKVQKVEAETRVTHEKVVSATCTKSQVHIIKIKD